MPIKNSAANLLLRKLKTQMRKLKTQKKRELFVNAVVLLFLLAGIVVVFHDYQWYDKTIVKIERTENTPREASKESGKAEMYFNQTLDGIVMNGAHRGERASLTNQYSSSGLLDDRYQSGDEVFVKFESDAAGKLGGTVTGLKRDKYMAVLVALFVFLLFLVTKRKGLFFIGSLAVNIAVLTYALHLNYEGENILMLSNGLVLFFALTSLCFISGINRKTLIAVLSTLISLGFTMLLFRIVMAYAGGVDYTYMEYIAGQNNLSELFLSQILIGGLGAIMDVAVTEASAINELVDKDSGISARELIDSGREVGYDIMGTMINIMLFAYICGAFPLIILKMKNNIELHTIITQQIPMELYRFIIGSIGILLAIPVTILVSILIFRKGRRVSC